MTERDALVAIHAIFGVAEGKLNDLDVQQEFAKTKELFARANRRFYKKLGIGVRIFNFFRTLGK